MINNNTTNTTNMNTDLDSTINVCINTDTASMGDDLMYNVYNNMPRTPPQSYPPISPGPDVILWDTQYPDNGARFSPLDFPDETLDDFVLYVEDNIVTDMLSSISNGGIQRYSNEISPLDRIGGTATTEEINRIMNKYNDE